MSTDEQKSGKAMWVFWIIAAVVAGAFLFPVADWLIVALLGLFGLGGLSGGGLSKAKKEIAQQAQKVAQQQQAIKETDAQLAKQADTIQQTTTEHQQLFITVSGKVEQERAQLEQVKQNLINQQGMSPEEATIYLRNALQGGATNDQK